MPVPRTGPGDRACHLQPTAAPTSIADPAGAIDGGERSVIDFEPDSRGFVQLIHDEKANIPQMLSCKMVSDGEHSETLRCSADRMGLQAIIPGPQNDAGRAVLLDIGIRYRLGGECLVSRWRRPSWHRVR